MININGLRQSLCFTSFSNLNSSNLSPPIVTVLFTFLHRLFIFLMKNFDVPVSSRGFHNFCRDIVSKTAFKSTTATDISFPLLSNVSIASFSVNI